MNALTKDFTDAVEKQFSALNQDVREALEQAGVAKAIAIDLEQKSVRGLHGGGSSGSQSFGQQLAQSQEFKSYQKDKYQGRFRVELKEITSAEGGVFSARDNEIAGMAKRQLRVRDLLNVVPTDSGSVDYTRQTTRTNAAAPVAEGATKPYSDYVWEQINLPMRVIAHLAKITRQAMDDNRQLQSEIDTEMRYGLGLKEEEQLLNGSGVAPNLNGLVTNATAYAAPFDPAGTETMIDQIGLAILQQSLTEFETDGIIIHPSDWMRMRLLKDADGKYLLGDPGADTPQVLFGKNVVTSQAMTINKFLVGGFSMQRLYDRLSPEVLISSENANDFETNMFTLRCEERIGLAIRQPTALIYGDFANIV